MISIAITVVALVILALGAMIVIDISTGGRLAALGILRQWQTLIGTMLGFVTGAGILAISTGISDRSDALRRQDELQRVGEALLVEARTLDEVLGRAAGLRAAFETAKRSCPSELLEINASIHHDKPMYDAAVPHFVAVGAPNLSLFVDFYGTYGEIERNIASFVSRGCPPVGPEAEASVFAKLAAARKAFQAIEAEYRGSAVK